MSYYVLPAVENTELWCCRPNRFPSRGYKAMLRKGECEAFDSFIYSFKFGMFESIKIVCIISLK